MTGLLRKAMLLACAGVLAASSAMAAVPSPDTSILPCGINLVNLDGAGQPDNVSLQPNGTPTPNTLIKIVVNDIATNPVVGSAVVIDFDACVGPAGQQDIRLCAAQPYPGVTATCSAPAGVGQISAVTDGNGEVNIRIVGGANNTGNLPGAGFKCATVYADGVNLGTVNVGAYNEDGLGGPTPNALAADGSAWLADFFDNNANGFVGRSDFDCSGTLLADFAYYLTAFFGDVLNSCASYCP